MNFLKKQLTKRVGSTTANDDEDGFDNMFRNTEKYNKQQKNRTKDRANGKAKKMTLFKHADKAVFKNIFS